MNVGQRRAAEQLIAAAVAFGFVLVLKVAFESCFGGGFPVGGARADSAPAVGVVHIGNDPFARQVDARA